MPAATLTQPTVTPLPAFVEAVLTRECPGGEADYLDIMPPLTVRPGEAFTVSIAALHKRSLPSIECDWSFKLECPESGMPPIDVSFEKGCTAVRQIENVAFDREGVFRLQTNLNGQIVYSTPVVCRKKLPFRVYWGDPHVHTILSQCHFEHCRTLDFAYFAGRYAAGLDWMACADHVSNGRCEGVRWREESRTSNNHDDPGRFVALPAYEASLKGGCGGDNNIYMRRWPDLFVDHYDEGNAKTLLEEMHGKLPPEDVVAIPHHTTRTGKHGEIPHDIYPGPSGMPAVEIASNWGVSEFRGNPDPLREIHPGPSYVRDLLAQGLPLAFVGGTDTHTSIPFRHDQRLNGPLRSDPGGTGVCADELTRDGVFDAFRERRTYAGTLRKSFLHVTINGARTGTVTENASSTEPRTIVIEAAGASEIASLQIIRNGEVVHELADQPWHMTHTWKDTEPLNGITLSSPFLPGPFAYYYVRVVYADGAKAWSSPVWVCLSA